MNNKQFSIGDSVCYGYGMTKQSNAVGFIIDIEEASISAIVIYDEQHNFKYEYIKQDTLQNSYQTTFGAGRWFFNIKDLRHCRVVLIEKADKRLSTYEDIINFNNL